MLEHGVTPVRAMMSRMSPRGASARGLGLHHRARMKAVIWLLSRSGHDHRLRGVAVLPLAQRTRCDAQLAQALQVDAIRPIVAIGNGTPPSSFRL